MSFAATPKWISGNCHGAQYGKCRKRSECTDCHLLPLCQFMTNEQKKQKRGWKESDVRS